MSNICVKDKIKKAYEVISSINKEAYKDIFLVSNQVLNKNPYNNNFLNHFLNDKIPRIQPFYTLIYKILVYYVKTFLHFALYLFRFTEYYFSFTRFSFSKESKELILIDVSFIMEKIKKSGSFRDEYFPGLEDVLKKKNKYYAYLPIFYSIRPNQLSLELYEVLKILKKEKIPVITEYQLLSFYDLMKLLYFIMVYPFHVLRFSGSLREKTYQMDLLKHELLDTIDHVRFYSFSRYLQGRRVAELPFETIKVISWYENQTVHKNFYKGLKEGKPTAKIYGAQLFLYSRNCPYIWPDENEADFGVVPDKIIVSGPFYIPKKTNLNYMVGPSLRSSKIFQIAVKKENQKNIVVLLPYFSDVAENILRILFDKKISSRNILIKTHPATPIEKCRYFIPAYARITDEDIYKLFETAKIVISASSGILMEAVSLGIPSISIRDTKKGFDYNNPLSEYGEGIIWEEVRTSKDLIQQVEKFEYKSENNSEELQAIASEYRNKFFCKASVETIKKAFDLE